MPKRTILLVLAGLALAGAIASQFLTILVQPPIGAVPDGVTAIIMRKGEMQFVESADAVCDRRMGGVSLLCRGIALGKLIENNKPLIRLPYSKQLYLISTGGKVFDR